MKDKENTFLIEHILPATDALLLNDVYLVLIDMLKVPPHLAVAVNGKLFTLTVNGATIEGELSALLRLIHKKNIPCLFVKLNIPFLFTPEDIKNEIKKYTLLYPRVDIGIATCLAPINDFCESVYQVDKKSINFIYQLIPALNNQNATAEIYHLNMERILRNSSFEIMKYSMYDIYEGIRKANLVTV